MTTKTLQDAMLCGMISILNKPRHIFCIYQSRTWTSNVICRGLEINEYTWEVIVQFVDVDGNVHHNRLSKH